MATKRAIIAELLRNSRPDLANVVAHGRIVTADAKDLADAADRVLGPFVKTIQSRADRVIELADEWALRGDFSSRKIKLALTKLIQEHEKITKLKAPSNLRPREKERFEQTLKGKDMVINSLKEEHKALGKINHHDMKATERFIRGLKREAEFAAELMKMSVEGIKEWASMLVPKEFKLGKFDVIDDYGIHERTAEPWFTSVVRASKILEKAGFGYLLYGELHLSVSDEWGGMYYSKGDRVDLYINQHRRGNPESLIGTLVHELGHRLWFKFMDAGQRDQFSAPWVDQEEVLRDLHENMNEHLRVPKKEREEALKILKQSHFDYSTFKRWVEQDAAKAFRWYAWLTTSFFTSSQEPLNDKRELDKTTFDRISDRLYEWEGRIDDLSLKISELKPQPLDEDDRQLLPQSDIDSWNEKQAKQVKRRTEQFLDYISEHRKAIANFWEDVREGLVDGGPHRGNSEISMRELRDAFEPGSKKSRHPRATQIHELLKIAPIKPSVTEYGQTNRKEDFAETFEEVLTGKERSHEVMVRLNRALPRGSSVLSNVTAGAGQLYHTTSLKNLLSIVRQQKLIPGSTDTPFVSFGERPYFGDISHNEAVLVFDRKGVPDVMKVEYNERWFDRYPDQGAYIAGEGWHEQYEPPQECFEYDEEEDWEEEDEECLQRAYHEAEVGAFMAKSDEREWISKREHQPVKFRPEHIMGVLLKKGSVEAMEKELWKLGLNHVEVRKI